MSGDIVETAFSRVDRSGMAAGLVAYLDGLDGLGAIRDYKLRGIELLDPRPGQAVLEIGCGTGEFSRLLAAAVRPAGRVTAVDASEAMLAVCRERGGDGIEFVHGDARRLDFPDASFDRAYSDRVFQHLSDPGAALAEARRVLRPGGRAVVCDPDWETLVVDSDRRELTRRILNFHCDAVSQGWIGRRLPALFADAGFGSLRIEATTIILRDCATAEKFLGVRHAARRALEAGVIDEDAFLDWLDELTARDRAGRFFCSVTGFAVAGHRTGGTA